jgi:hypothetical protein
MLNTVIDIRLLMITNASSTINAIRSAATSEARKNGINFLLTRVTFPEAHMKTVAIKHTYWNIAADLYFPDDFDETKNIRQLSVPIRLEAVKSKPPGVFMVPHW